jgi:NADPH-dependent 2,4-dienoyl-CoA reductase/sulfur reductase-like enzyme
MVASEPAGLDTCSCGPRDADEEEKAHARCARQARVRIRALMSYDALVVGSGPNGLSAAIRLAQSGWRVLVLEAAERPGGAVATEELTLPGFLHDTYSAVYPAAAASPVLERLPLQRHGLRWIHPGAC